MYQSIMLFISDIDSFYLLSIYLSKAGESVLKMIGYEQSAYPDGPFGLPALGALRASVS